MVNTTEANEGVTTYEVGYLLLPSIAEDKVGEVVERLQGLVSKAGGEVLDGEEPFKYDLSYKMSKTVGASHYVVSEAYLGWFKFSLEAAKALEVKSAIEKQDEVLRALMIKVPRETSFTFAKAKALIAEKEAEARSREEALANEEATPVEAVVE